MGFFFEEKHKNSAQSHHAHAEPEGARVGLRFVDTAGFAVGVNNQAADILEERRAQGNAHICSANGRRRIAGFCRFLGAGKADNEKSAGHAEHAENDTKESGRGECGCEEGQGNVHQCVHCDAQQQNFFTGTYNFVREPSTDGAAQDHAYSKLLLQRIPEQYDTNAPTVYGKVQCVLDYISGMTDVYALDLYRKITGMSLPAV